MERDGAEAKSSEENGDALGLVDGAGEDDDWVANVVVEEMNEVKVLLGVWDDW